MLGHDCCRCLPAYPSAMDRPQGFGSAAHARMPRAMTTHPVSNASEQDAARRLKRRAWQAYLDDSRSSHDYDTGEQEAWERLQERLVDIDAELLLAHGAGA